MEIVWQRKDWTNVEDNEHNIVSHGLAFSTPNVKPPNVKFSYEADATKAEALDKSARHLEVSKKMMIAQK